jgi:hypothetical protein
MPPSKTSWIHAHYEEETIERAGKTIGVRRCRHCGTHFSLNSSTDTLTKHYRRDHDGARPPPRRRLPPSSPCNDPSVKRLRTAQSTLDMAVYRINNGDLPPALASLWAHCSWAHRVIELPQFLEVAAALRSSDCRLPSRAQLRAAQIHLAESLRARVVRQLRNYCRSSPLTVAIDGWTNVNTAKVTNVVIICGGEAYYWCSIVNSSHHNTALWLRDPLVTVLNNIKAEGLVFSALVADNERVNHKLWEQLVEPFPFLIRSPCAAHLVQLCVIKALELPGIERVLTDMEELLCQFRLKVNRLQLKEVQVAAKKAPLNVLRPCDTRWSSQLYAADRLYQLKSFVDLVIEQPPQFWVNIQQIIEFLKPFQVATDVIQQDSSTLFDTYTHFMALLTHVRSIKPTSMFYLAKDDVTNVIIDMWEKHININAIICCAILSFDSSVKEMFDKQIHAAELWFFNFSAKYAQAWTLSTTTDYEQLRREVKSQWANFTARASDSNFCTLASDIDDLRAQHRDEGRPFDPRAVWHMHLTHAPVIAHSAVALLSVAASEAAVERTFSAQGDVHSDRRNRLADRAVEAEMFIKFNEGTVKAVEQWEEEGKDKRKPRRRRRIAVPKLVMEMSEDVAEEEIDEGAVSVKSLFTRPERKAAESDLDEEQNHPEGKQDSEAEPAAAASAVVSAVPPPSNEDATLAFIRAYVKNHGIQAHFRWRDYHLQQLEAAGQEWTPKMREGPVALKKKIMAWVRNQIEEEDEEKKEQQPSVAEEEKMVE